MSTTIPRIAHFVVGMRPQDEPFHLVHYLALASCRAVVQPDEIHVHCRELPYGFYWDLARDFITLHRVDMVEQVDAHEYADPFVASFRYAHHSDFIRLDVLAEHGGLYADIDTLFVHRPPDDLWQEACVIGREADVVDQESGITRTSVSNALIMAAPGSAFIERWRETMSSSFDGSWAAHSCFLADDLATTFPDDVRVAPERTFHAFPPSPAGLQRLLVEVDDDLDDVVSIHMAAHLWWAEDRRDFVGEVNSHTIDERWVRAGTTTYARAAARFLPDHGYF